MQRLCVALQRAQLLPLAVHIVLMPLQVGRLEGQRDSEWRVMNIILLLIILLIIQTITMMAIMIVILLLLIIMLIIVIMLIAIALLPTNS